VHGVNDEVSAGQNDRHTNQKRYEKNWHDPISFRCSCWDDNAPGRNECRVHDIVYSRFHLEPRRAPDGANDSGPALGPLSQQFPENPV